MATNKVSGTGPQDAFNENQNYDVDINKIYQDFVVEIDKMRSNVSVQNNPSLQSITAFNTSTSPANVKIETTPQESRCHAFYRLLGLPVSDGDSLYCPGFDQPNNSDQQLAAHKITIAGNLLEDPILSVINIRETVPRSYLSIFALQDVNAMALAMSSAEVRFFQAPLTSLTGAFDANLNHQIYTSNITQRLINNVHASDGYTLPTNINSFIQRFHILSPFIVDPRIDFNVYPKRNTIAVPFLADKSQTKLTENVYLKRPYIEKVCRDRFDASNTTAKLGPSLADIASNIKANPFFQDNSLIQSAFNLDKITGATVQFANYFNAIRSTLKQLYKAIQTVRVVMAADPNSNNAAKYNWTPIPDKSGPEFGSTTRDLFSQQFNDPHNTKYDWSIIGVIYQQQLTSISNKLTTQQDVDIGGFAFDNIELTPDQNSTDALGDTNAAPIDTSQSERQSLTDAANEALKTIEIITGEFSGLGLIDIFVISAAFWIMDKTFLISLLDTIAVNRMITNANLQDPIALQAKNEPIHSPLDAIGNFQSQVLQIYQVVDLLWIQIQTQNTS